MPIPEENENNNCTCCSTGTTETDVNGISVCLPNCCTQLGMKTNENGICVDTSTEPTCPEGHMLKMVDGQPRCVKYCPDCDSFDGVVEIGECPDLTLMPKTEVVVENRRNIGIYTFSANIHNQTATWEFRTVTGNTYGDWEDASVFNPIKYNSELQFRDIDILAYLNAPDATLEFRYSITTTCGVQEIFLYAWIRNVGTVIVFDRTTFVYRNCVYKTLTAIPNQTDTYTYSWTLGPGLSLNNGSLTDAEIAVCINGTDDDTSYTVEITSETCGTIAITGEVPYENCIVQAIAPDVGTCKNEYKFDLTFRLLYDGLDVGDVVKIILLGTGLVENFDFIVDGSGNEEVVIPNLTAIGETFDMNITVPEKQNCYTLQPNFAIAPNRCECSMSLSSATPSVCDPNTNTYSLDVALNLENIPSGETISINSQTFVSDGTTAQTFTLTGLTAQSIFIEEMEVGRPMPIFVQLPNLNTCFLDVTDAYTSPIPCTPTPACKVTILSTIASECNENSNTYNVTVQVSYSNVGAMSTLNISTNSDASGQIFMVSGTNSAYFTLQDLVADGNIAQYIKVFVVEEPTCENTMYNAFDAPEACEIPPCQNTAIVQRTENSTEICTEYVKDETYFESDELKKNIKFKVVQNDINSTASNTNQKRYYTYASSVNFTKQIAGQFQYHPSDPNYYTAINYIGDDIVLTMEWPHLYAGPHKVDGCNFQPMEHSGYFIDITLDGTTYAPNNIVIVWNQTTDPDGTTFKNNLQAFLNTLNLGDIRTTVYVDGNSKLWFIVKVYVGNGYVDSITNLRYKVTALAPIIDVLNNDGNIQICYPSITLTRELETECGIIDYRGSFAIDLNNMGVIIPNGTFQNFNINNTNIRFTSHEQLTNVFPQCCTAITNTLTASLANTEPIVSVSWQLFGGLKTVNGDTTSTDASIEVIGSGSYIVTITTVDGCQYPYTNNI